MREKGGLQGVLARATDGNGGGVNWRYFGLGKKGSGSMASLCTVQRMLAAWRWRSERRLPEEMKVTSGSQWPVAQVRMGRSVAQPVRLVDWVKSGQVARSDSSLVWLVRSGSSPTVLTDWNSTF